MPLRSALKHLLLALGYGALGVVVAEAFMFASYMRDRPDLSPWHLATLDEEYSAAKATAVPDLPSYLALEDRLFRQVEHDTMQAGGDNVPGQRLNRYAHGSLIDPTSYPTNWNRTFELSPPDPRAGFLLLHGLSDSPYSLRALGQNLYQQGASVVGLRLPGHGTAPVGLTHVTWHDFTAAVQMAVRDMAARLGPNRPLYLVGYSNGAALAIHYSLTALEDSKLPKPAGLLLFSPALAVSPTAALAKWNLLMAKLPGLEKLAWVSIQPEYDPYKYNSFAVNAGEQVYQLTNDINARITRLDTGKGIADFPPILAFQSVVDATVLPHALVDRLFAHLAPNQHELVLFDINRQAETNAFFSSDPHADVEAFFSRPQPFAMTLVTNRSPDTTEIIAMHRAVGSSDVVTQETGLAWPPGIFSLSHVALTFPPDDVVYGTAKHNHNGLPSLGAIDARGETGVLQVPLSQLLRLRYNPFYSFVWERVLPRYFLGTTTPSAQPRPVQ